MHRLSLVELAVSEGKGIYVLGCFGGPVNGGPAVSFWHAGVKQLASPEKGLCLIVHEAGSRTGRLHVASKGVS